MLLDEGVVLFLLNFIVGSALANLILALGLPFGEFLLSFLLSLTLARSLLLLLRVKNLFPLLILNLNHTHQLLLFLSKVVF